MTATYQNNIKNIKLLLGKNNLEKNFYDPRAYPYHDQELLHKSLSYAMDPWKDAYSSPLIHINLFQVTIAKQISSLPLFLVKDGLFTLIEFFHRCPSPKDFKAIVLIHNSLKNFVPNGWRARVVFYEFEYKKLASSVFQQQNDQVIIKANITEGMFDYESAKKKIIELKKRKFSKFNFFFFHRSDPFLAKDWDIDLRLIEYVNNQSKFINFLEKEKIDHEFLTWKEFFHVQSAHQFSCIDLNYKEKYYIDDFTNFHFLKKGMTPLNLTSSKGSHNDLYVPITANHGIRILGEEPTYETDKIDEIFKNLKVMNTAKDKFDIGAFQMVNEVAGKKLDSAWLKTFN